MDEEDYISYWELIGDSFIELWEDEDVSDWMVEVPMIHDRLPIEVYNADNTDRTNISIFVPDIGNVSIYHYEGEVAIHIDFDTDFVKVIDRHGNTRSITD